MRTNQATNRKLARLALPGLLCVALSFGGVGTANALVVNWVDGTSFWDIVTNWSGGVLPTAADDVVINVAGVPTITHRIGNTTIRTLGISQPATVVVTNASSLTVTNSSTNTGTIRADGGSFNLFGSVVTNNGGTIEAINNSVVQLQNGGGIAGGTISTATGGVIRVVGTAGLNGESSWAGALTNSGLFEVSNGSTLSTAGTFNNNGTFLLNSSGSNATFQVGGPTTLQGSGTLTMGDHPNNRITGYAATDRLTNAASHTIQGSGNIGNNFMTMSNAGLIVANQLTPLIIDMTNAVSGHDPAISGIINTGVLRADGGTLVLYDNLVHNAGGTVEALNGSVVQLQGGGGIAGGTLSTSGSGVIRVVGLAGLNGETSWAGALTINGSVEVSNGSTLATAGTFNNNGTILLNSTGNNTVFTVGATTLQGSGTLTMGNNTQNFITGVAATDRLTNAAGHTIQGSGNIGNDFMAMSNHGLIHANQPTALIINPSNCLGCGLTNTGTLRAAAGSTLTVTDSLTNFSGTTLSGGTYEVYGTASQPGTMRLANANIVTNAATILLDGPNSNLLRHDTGTNSLTNFAANAAAGSFTIQNGRDFATAGLLINAGNVTVGPASTLTVGSGANFLQTAGVTAVNGTLAASLADIQGGILKGGGTVSGNVVNQGGTVAPGNSPGTLTVQGSFAQLAGGTLNIELDGLSSFDLLAVSGNATLGGTLSVVKLANYNPHVGDSFRVMTFADHGATTFDNVSYSGFGTGVLFGVTYNPTDVTLQVAAVPEAETWAMLLVGIGLIGFRLRGGRLAREGAIVR